MRDEKYLSQAPPPLQRERGGCLSLWLAFFVMVNVYTAFNFARQGIWLPAAWSAFAVICGFGVWRWQKLAFYGLLLGYGFNIAMNVDNSSLQGVMFNLIYAGLTYFLVQQKIEYFK
jgi:hypothetical protein